MGNVVFQHVYKHYKGEPNPAVNDFHLDVAEGEFLVMVGPSGCGKSTTLRMLAGLEDVSKGNIYIDGKFTNYVSPKDRDIAMVFQNYALYPNLSVYENMALGLQLRKVAKHEVELRVSRAAKMLEISHLLTKRPAQLSGGQKQRVALGRALVREPKAFLMDEPLSNLDAKLRAQTRAEIIKIHSQLQTTFVYVTHDQTEAMTMGTRIVVMRDGRIQQVAAPQILYDEPSNKFVASFIGSPQMNFIDGIIALHENGFYFENRRLRLPLPKAYARHLQGMGQGLPKSRRQVVLGLRPEHVLCNADALQAEPYGEWQVQVTVAMKEPMGSDTYIHTDLGGTTIVSRADAHIPVRIGETIKLVLRMDKVHLFERESGESLLLRGASV
ncbi:ABC transporter ATP-binding protein [Paenibacillus sp. PAMC21692]|uniref:ABC transporter ATP-binding protein n=1 Tax=Paenibacillus sp. PAMC21692 TaxID=2762320 RepID=UPI00164DF962|nr:sn-glycerol-3-phosphate ABC transporter ATP-binding protein UgpC [Paenibacillus sp. PAMC21692]QNK54864.1 sn-glycerol-3-phosphate ABC transporter ATP-binding protein UgpC [Paenibacillus sp. PAMC21692]